jgi:hypothetical protein
MKTRNAEAMVLLTWKYKEKLPLFKSLLKRIGSPAYVLAFIFFLISFEQMHIL